MICLLHFYVVECVKLLTTNQLALGRENAKNECKTKFLPQVAKMRKNDVFRICRGVRVV